MKVTLPAGTPELHQPAAQPELFEVPDDALLESVITGLRQTPKRISPVWFYDERGSHLFDQITELPEYYVTRTELAIFRTHGRDIAEPHPRGRFRRRDGRPRRGVGV